MLKRQLAFGYSREDVEQLVLPMGKDGVEPVGREPDIGASFGHAASA